MVRRSVLAASLMVMAACSPHATGGAQQEADRITRAVYNNDVDSATENFDDSIKPQVTRTEVGIMSDQMHKLGDYKGLTYVNDDASRNKYTYRGDFTNGSMNVVIRLDPDGKVAAYRVYPLASP